MPASDLTTGLSDASDDSLTAAERALADHLASLEAANAALRRRVCDARETALARAEARLRAATAAAAAPVNAAAGVAALAPLLTDALAARRGWGEAGAPPPRAAAAARVATLLRPAHADDFAASDAVALAALASGPSGRAGGPVGGHLGGLKIALTVGPHAGAAVSIADMLAWPPGDFVATVKDLGSFAAANAAAAVRAARAPSRSELATAAALQSQLRAVSTVMAAAQPRNALDVAALTGGSEASEAEEEAAADRAAGVRAAVAGARLTRAERAALTTLQSAYGAKLAPLLAARRAALATLAATLLPVHAAAPLERRAAAAALDAAEALAASLDAAADANLELQVDVAAALALERGGMYVGLRWPRAPSAADMVDCVAVDAGAPPLAVVLGSVEGGEA